MNQPLQPRPLGSFADDAQPDVDAVVAQKARGADKRVVALLLNEASDGQDCRRRLLHWVATTTSGLDAVMREDDRGARAGEAREVAMAVRRAREHDLCVAHLPRQLLPRRQPDVLCVRGQPEGGSGEKRRETADCRGPVREVHIERR